MKLYSQLAQWWPLLSAPEDYAYLLRQGEQTRVEYDRHIEGLFARADWLEWLEQTGFQASSVVDAYERDLFIGLRPR